MTSPARFAFRIDALARDAVPMRDLAAYLTDLVQLLGHYEAVHLLGVRDGSLELQYVVDEEAVQDVIDRVEGAHGSGSDPTARRAYRNIDKRLKGHDSGAVIVQQVGPGQQQTVLDIPGALAPDLSLPAVWSSGTVDGIPTGVGGRQVDPDWMPVRLHDTGASLRCEARPPVAIEIGQFLLRKPIRAVGRGRWVRDEQDGWSLDKFQIVSFEELDDRPLAEVLPDLRRIYAETDWAEMDDPVGSLARLRESP